MPQDVVIELLALEKGQCPGALVIDDLCIDDLAHIAWSGEPRHLVTVRRTLERVAGGEVEYVCARAPSGAPVAKVCIDYLRYPDAGYLSQFATHPALQGQGIGSHLMAGAERRIRRRGRVLAHIRVEGVNPRAKALYERLGFEEFGHDVEANVVLLRKDLGQPTADDLVAG